jgi:hypothetical protein
VKWHSAETVASSECRTASTKIVAKPEMVGVAKLIRAEPGNGPQSSNQVHRHTQSKPTLSNSDYLAADRERKTMGSCANGESAASLHGQCILQNIDGRCRTKKAVSSGK